MSETRKLHHTCDAGMMAAVKSGFELVKTALPRTPLGRGGKGGAWRIMCRAGQAGIRAAAIACFREFVLDDQEMNCTAKAMLMARNTAKMVH